MGYEVAGGLGVKMAAPDREVYVMVGDGSWLMMSSELVTSLQEGVKLTIILIDNHGFASIGALSNRSDRQASERSTGFAMRIAANGEACCPWILPPTRNRSAHVCIAHERWWS